MNIMALRPVLGVGTTICATNLSLLRFFGKERDVRILEE